MIFALIRLLALLSLSTFGYFPAADAIILPKGVFLQRLNPEESAKLGHECGNSTESMAGGRKHPWAVSFVARDRNKLGGTIISAFHILTVAHGFVRFDNSGVGPCDVFGYRRVEQLQSSWSIVLGDDCIRSQHDDFACARPNLTRHRIRAVFVDDGFAEGGCVGGHDWAVVEVEERIQFSARVQPICLPLRGGQTIAEGEVLTVTSWGRKDAFHKGDPLIREIPMRHDSECKARPWADNMPTRVEDYLCAKALNPKDFRTLRTCHGDSGSGMEWRPYETHHSLNGTTGRIRAKLSPEHQKEGEFNGTEAGEQQNGASGNNSTRAVEEQPKGTKASPRRVMHSPVWVPELDFMRQWPVIARAKAADTQRVATAIPLPQPLESQNGSRMAGESAAKERHPRGRAQLVGVTSFGSRQCSSDELARFTRIDKYLEKVCALTGVCYPLGR